MKSAAPDYSSLIGVPYSKMNCWEAVRAYYRVVIGVELHHYCQDTPEDRSDIKNLIYSNVGDFASVDYPGPLKSGDLLLFLIKGVESHIGVYVGEGRFFHSSKTTDSCVDRLDRWKTLVAGVYRLKGEAA